MAWDLDTTGRRLIDEICQIGAYAVIPNSAEDETDETGKRTSQEAGVTFSQYVMPYRNPNPGARRSFGIKVSVTLLYFLRSEKAVQRLRSEELEKIRFKIWH